MLNNQLEFQRNRLILWLPVLMGIGIAVYFMLPTEPKSYLGPAVFLNLASMAYITRRKRTLFVIVIALSFIALGFAAASIKTANIQANPLQKTIEDARIYGVITHVEKLDTGYRFILRPDYIRDKNGVVMDKSRHPAELRLKTFYKGIALKSGMEIGFNADIFPLPLPAYPGGYDFGRQLFFDEIGGSGYTRSRIWLNGEENPSGLVAYIESIRDIIHTRIEGVLEKPVSSVAKAMITGEQSEISESLILKIRNSGLAHILAISGFNIGIVAGMVFWLSRLLLAMIPPIALRYNIKKIAAILALISAALYTAISGLAVPAIRSFIMLCFMLVSVMIDRKAISLRNVAWAAIVIMLYSPESALSISFHLSFAATIALVAFYEDLSPKFMQWTEYHGPLKKIAGYVTALFATTFVAGMISLPYGIYHFNQIPNYSQIANLLAVPLTSIVVMPGVLAAMCAMPLGWEEYPLRVMEIGIRGMLWVAEFFADLPGAVTLLPSPPLWGIISFSLGALWMCIWRGGLKKWGLAFFALSVLSLFFINLPVVIADGKQTVINTENKVYYIATRKTGNFVSDVWKKHLAVAEYHFIPTTIRSNLPLCQLIMACHHNDAGDHSNYCQHLTHHDVARNIKEFCAEYGAQYNQYHDGTVIFHRSTPAITTRHSIGNRPWN
jgi:competence protein ComEC